MIQKDVCNTDVKLYENGNAIEIWIVGTSMTWRMSDMKRNCEQTFIWSCGSGADTWSIRDLMSRSGKS